MRGNSALRIPAATTAERLNPFLSYPAVETTNRAQLASAQARYSEFLKRNKMFLTKERVALVKFLFDQSGHFSADELLGVIFSRFCIGK